MAKIRKTEQITVGLTAEQSGALGLDAGQLAEWLEIALGGIAALRIGQDSRYTPDSMTGRPLGDLWAERTLQATSALIGKLEGLRAAALREHAADQGSTGRAGIAMGTSKATAQTRRDALRKAPTPAELWARGRHGETDHAGASVPDGLCSWSTPWPGYTPVDITPPELWPEGLRTSASKRWAEPYASPEQVPDMLHRSLNAVIRYDLDDRFWPLNPAGRTGRSGRNLSRWGENVAADLLVTADEGPDRMILLIKRSDRSVWATPGGHVEDGESALAAMVREAREESGIEIDPATVRVGTPRQVDDWRNTDHAWMVTTPGYAHLPAPVAVTGADDALEAKWWPYPDMPGLLAALSEAGQTLYDAHRPILEQHAGEVEPADAEPRDRAEVVAELRRGLEGISSGLEAARQPARRTVTRHDGPDGTVINVNDGGTVGIQAYRIEG